MTEAGLSIKDVAELLGCTRVYVGYLLSKRSLAGLEHALRLEEITVDFSSGPIAAREWVTARRTGTDG